MFLSLQVELVDNSLNLLMDLYLSKQLAVPMKVKVLQMMKLLLKAANSKFMGPSSGTSPLFTILVPRTQYLYLSRVTIRVQSPPRLGRS